MSFTTCRKCGVPILGGGDSPREDFLGMGRLCVHCAGEEPDARRRFIERLDRLVPTGPAPRPGGEGWRRRDRRGGEEERGDQED